MIIFLEFGTINFKCHLNISYLLQDDHLSNEIFSYLDEINRFNEIVPLSIPES